MSRQPDGSAPIQNPIRSAGDALDVRPWLLIAILIAAVLRLTALTSVPPGLNQDEACNAWNAWCLLKTGQDQAGVRWPVFYTRGLGDNRSVLFLYILMPFQELFGLNVFSTRLPVALAGIAFVPLAYWLGSRLFNRGAGLAAAFLLALNPWAIQLSRWGIESCLTGVSTAAALAAAMWAGLPIPGATLRTSSWRAGLAGIFAGVLCYGYPAVRLFLPAFFLLVMIVFFRSWVAGLRDAAARPKILMWAAGIALTLGPLAWEHLAHGDEIGRRAAARWVWSSDDSVLSKMAKAAGRYAPHFGPDFLFFQGDHYEVAWTGGQGVFPPYSAVLMIVGVAFVLRAAIREHAARLLLLWLLAYPLADCLHSHMSSHVLRAAPGIAPLVLLAAVGLAEAVRFLRRRGLRTILLVASVGVGGLAVEQHGRSLYDYFVTRNHETPILHGYHADLMQACDWLRGRWLDFDAVVVTPTDMTHPYSIMMVGLNYDPRRWFAEPREISTFHEWDIYLRVGRFRFPIDSVGAELERLRGASFSGRVLTVARPGEVSQGNLLHVIPWHNGQAALELREIVFN